MKLDDPLTATKIRDHNKRWADTINKDGKIRTEIINLMMTSEFVGKVLASLKERFPDET